MRGSSRRSAGGWICRQTRSSKATGIPYGEGRCHRPLRGPRNNSPLERPLIGDPVMPSSADPNFDSLGLARQIIDLNAEVDREVRAEHYERAAELRDRREVLQRQLSRSGNPTVVQN